MQTVYGHEVLSESRRHESVGDDNSCRRLSFYYKHVIYDEFILQGQTINRFIILEFWDDCVEVFKRIDLNIGMVINGCYTMTMILLIRDLLFMTFAQRMIRQSFFNSRACLIWNLSTFFYSQALISLKR